RRLERPPLRDRPRAAGGPRDGSAPLRQARDPRASPARRGARAGREPRRSTRKSEAHRRWCKRSLRLKEIAPRGELAALTGARGSEYASPMRNQAVLLLALAALLVPAGALAKPRAARGPAVDAVRLTPYAGAAGG